MPGSRRQEGKGQELGKGSQPCSPHLSEEGEVLRCFKLTVFRNFCACRAANSGAICLCSQPRSPGINSFLLWFLREVLAGVERERREASDHLVL